MEMHCGQSNPALKRNKISLEEYLDFIESRKQLDLTVNYLNQIISTHGFSKLKAQKKVLVDALNSMDLMNPSRSTIYNDDVSSFAYIPMEEAMQDLLDLNWKECSVASIQTLNSVNHDFSLRDSHASTSKSKPRKSRTRSRNKVPRLEGVEGDKAIVTAATDVTGSGDKAIVIVSTAVTGSGNEPLGLIGETESACSVAVDYTSGSSITFTRKRMKSVNALINGEISKVIV